jgi:hypothetical protein
MKARCSRLVLPSAELGLKQDLVKCLDDADYLAAGSVDIYYSIGSTTGAGGTELTVDGDETPLMEIEMG